MCGEWGGWLGLEMIQVVWHISLQIDLLEVTGNSFKRSTHSLAHPPTHSLKSMVNLYEFLMTYKFWVGNEGMNQNHSTERCICSIHFLRVAQARVQGMCFGVDCFNATVRSLQKGRAFDLRFVHWTSELVGVFSIKSTFLASYVSCVSYVWLWGLPFFTNKSKLQRLVKSEQAGSCGNLLGHGVRAHQASKADIEETEASKIK